MNDNCKRTLLPLIKPHMKKTKLPLTVTNLHEKDDYSHEYNNKGKDMILRLERCKQLWNGISKIRSSPSPRRTATADLASHFLGHWNSLSHHCHVPMMTWRFTGSCWCRPECQDTSIFLSFRYQMKSLTTFSIFRMENLDGVAFILHSALVSNLYFISQAPI